jgi:hypothetical protein
MVYTPFPLPTTEERIQRIAESLARIEATLNALSVRIATFSKLVDRWESDGMPAPRTEENPT